MQPNWIKYYIKAHVTDCPDPSILSLEDSRIGAIFPKSTITRNGQEWLECNGQIVERSAYPLLFAAIGTRFGTGDGTSTFKLPTIITSTYIA